MRRLVVGSAILALAAASLSGAWADDQEIARKVADRLKQEQKEGNLQGFDINLRVAEGKVMLKGDVSSAEQKELAVDVTRQVDGVEEVIDSLHVKAAGESATASSGPPRKSLFSSLLSSEPAKRSSSGVSETPPKVKASDADVAQQIAAELKKEKDAGNLKDFDIDLAVKDSVAVLDGQVSSDEQAQLVSRAARGVAGVRDVISRLVVTESDNKLSATAKTSAKRATLGEPLAGPTSSATAKSGTSSRIASRQEPETNSKQALEDRRIGEELTHRLQEAKQSGQLRGFGISVHVENGYAWLKGRVGSAAQRQLVLDLARRTSGVRQVINELSLGEEPVNIAQDLTDRLQAAEAEGSLRGANLNVKVNGPDVWLTGTVSQPQQEQLAVDLARQVSGVRRVISGLMVAGTASQPRPVSAMPVAADLATVSAVRSGLPAASGNRANAAFAATPVATLSEPAAPARIASSAAPMVTVDQTPRPLGMGQLASYAGAAAAAPLAAIAGAAGMAPAQMPGPGYAVVPARYDHPSLPGYAWPSYAAHPNYAAVTYPKQYSPSAWPYIGPFYPYPQVPLGWRKVTMKWDDGWWNLDFKAK